MYPGDVPLRTATALQLIAARQGSAQDLQRPAHRLHPQLEEGPVLLGPLRYGVPVFLPWRRGVTTNVKGQFPGAIRRGSVIVIHPNVLAAQSAKVSCLRTAVFSANV